MSTSICSEENGKWTACWRARMDLGFNKLENKGAPKMQAEALIERIKSLPSEKIVEVEDFVEFLAQRAAKQEQLTDDEERAARLAEIAESMRSNTFTGNPPRFTREELHERR